MNRIVQKVKGVVETVKGRVAYEKESWEMSQEHMRQVRAEHPELWPKSKQ